MGFKESQEEYPILKIPPSCSHPKNTSATNFPQKVKFYLSHFSLCLFACRKHPGEILARLCLLVPCIHPLSSGELVAAPGEWDMGRLQIAWKGELELGAKGKLGQLRQLPRIWMWRRKEGVWGSGDSSLLLALGYRLYFSHLTQPLGLFPNGGIFSLFWVILPYFVNQGYEIQKNQDYPISHSWDQKSWLSDSKDCMPSLYPRLP